jgi:outer membrane protein assembly factor BamB
VKPAVPGEILSVEKDSPAAKAGILAGDVIELVNGEIATGSSLTRCLGRAAPGVEARLRVRRKAAVLEISFRLGETPSGKGTGIIGASFTQGYSLAIVWEDAAVAVDIRSGKRKWLFPAPFLIRGTKEGEGTLLLHGIRASEGRLACLEDSTGTVRWIRGFTSLSGKEPEVLLSTSFRDETVSFFRTGSSADLRVFDRETGALLGKVKTFSQAVISYRVDEENRVLYLLHAAALKDRRILGLSLGRENPGEVVDTLALPLNEIGRDLKGSRLFVRAPHLVLMVPSAGQVKPGGVHLFNTKSSSLMFSIALPPGRAWSPGMCETSPFDSDGNLYVYTETVAFETGDRAGFLGAYGLDNPGHLKWEAVVPALPPSAKARWRVETRIPGRLLFVSPQGKIPGGKGEMPVAALYSKERGGYLEQVFPSLDNRAWGSAVSLERRRLLLCTGEGVEVYGAR